MATEQGQEHVEQEPRRDEQQAQTYVLFVSKPTGYELVAHQGEPPPVGTVVELDGHGRFFVSRIGPSPLPQDRRPCAYLQPTPS
jgi:hypothetical protein